MNATDKYAVHQVRSLKWIVFLNRTLAEIITETCAFVLIGLTAIGGNLLVVASIYRNRALRTCTNYLTLSLAITDILNPLTVLPLTILWLITIENPYTSDPTHEPVCDFQLICLLTFTTVSGCIMALMAFNRFICVCKPDKYKNMFNKKKTLLMILGVWVACLIVAVLVVKGYLYYAKFSAQMVMCMPARKNKTTTTKIFGNVLLGVVIAVPYVIITYCYFNIFKKIRQHKRTIGGPTINTSVHALRVQEIKITWTIFAVLLGYLVTWVPVLVVALLASYDKSLPHNVTIILSFGIASNSAINPVIYGVMNPAFRREYIKILNSIFPCTRR